MLVQIKHYKLPKNIPGAKIGPIIGRTTAKIVLINITIQIANSVNIIYNYYLFYYHKNKII